ncbi:MAG: hypothetical protein RMJ56_08675 [Gemmataceae bacterium]|nr:hypothetical protein [Gemmata sp.]MDW8197660.1 hypothetical protein [Gemmataceae bacterium]
MKKRLFVLVAMAWVWPLLSSGCYPIARFRANHPYGWCCGWGYKYHPLLHPIQTRRAILSQLDDHPGPVTVPACHGCEAPGVPVGYGPYPVQVLPTGVPSIGTPMPITPGPSVIPQQGLPMPMELPKNSGNGSGSK